MTKIIKTLHRLLSILKNILVRALIPTAGLFFVLVLSLYAFSFIDEVSKTDFDILLWSFVNFLPYLYGMCVLFYLFRVIREFLKRHIFYKRRINLDSEKRFEL